MSETGTVRTAAPAWTRVPSPIGPLLLAATERGLLSVVFHADQAASDAALARIRRAMGARPVPDAAPLGEAAAQLAAYFAGELRAFSLPLDLRLTTGFHRRVLEVLAARVGYGTVVGYQDLADWVGEPGAARAVGAAMGANPLPIVIPCHRVVESGGGLGGFGGGLGTKRELLALEGVLPPPLF